MSQGGRWLEGFAVTATLLGVRDSNELRSLLPAGTPLPSWWVTWETAPTREERAKCVAPRIAKHWVAMREIVLR